jgi:hypothetical protein
MLLRGTLGYDDQTKLILVVVVSQCFSRVPWVMTIRLQNIVHPHIVTVALRGTLEL